MNSSIVSGADMASAVEDMERSDVAAQAYHTPDFGNKPDQQQNARSEDRSGRIDWGISRRVVLRTLRVELDVGFEHRLPDQVEVAAYYTISEALTNASKHANAERVRVSVEVEDATLLLLIRDDGSGGADASRGSGLTGLKDRIEGLGGKIRVTSPPGTGTTIEVSVPILQSSDPNGVPDTQHSPR